MKRAFLFFMLAAALISLGGLAAAAETGGAPDLSLQHIRNATLKLTSGGTTFLVDPMLAEPGAYEGFPDTYRSWLRNPLTPLPMPVEEILAGVDAVILTHTHLDHWDPAAQDAIPKDMPILVQHEEDARLVRDQGFTNVRILKESDAFGGVKLDRTATRHGTEAMYAAPEVAKLLGEVMGVVFTTPGGRKAYLAADTVWFDGVDEALGRHTPDVIILNTGGAALTADAFKDNPEIIMGKEDVLRAVRAAPQATVIGVHMDAINHMTVDRKDLARYVREKGIRDRVLIPFDGEIMEFSMPAE